MNQILRPHTLLTTVISLTKMKQNRLHHQKLLQQLNRMETKSRMTTLTMVKIMTLMMVTLLKRIMKTLRKKRRTSRNPKL